MRHKSVGRYSILAGFVLLVSAGCAPVADSDASGDAAITSRTLIVAMGAEAAADLEVLRSVRSVITPRLAYPGPTAGQIVEHEGAESDFYAWRIVVSASSTDASKSHVTALVDRRGGAYRFDLGDVDSFAAAVNDANNRVAVEAIVQGRPSVFTYSLDETGANLCDAEWTGSTCAGRAIHGSAPSSLLDYASELVSSAADGATYRVLATANSYGPSHLYLSIARAQQGKPVNVYDLGTAHCGLLGVAALGGGTKVNLRYTDISENGAETDTELSFDIVSTSASEYLRRVR